VVEGLALGQVVLAAEAGDVDEHAAPDHALLGDRQHRGAVHAVDGGAGVVAVPEFPVVPEVAQRVVLRGALQEDLRGVVGVVQAAGELRPAPAVPGRLVEHVLAPDPLAARPERVAGPLGAAHLDLQGEHLTGPDVPHPPQHLVGVEVVQAAQFVVRAPSAPVGRGVGAQQVAHRRGFGHRRLLTPSGSP
jgi:hypothetical protein